MVRNFRLPFNFFFFYNGESNILYCLSVTSIFKNYSNGKKGQCTDQIPVKNLFKLYLVTIHETNSNNKPFVNTHNTAHKCFQMNNLFSSYTHTMFLQLVLLMLSYCGLLIYLHDMLPFLQSLASMNCLLYSKG